MTQIPPANIPSRQRRLLLLRHAKSAWPEGVEDHQRPLAERGLKAAPVVGNYMAHEHLVPDLALISDAKRTQETWKLIISRLPGKVDARITPELYEASAIKLLEVLRQSGPGADTVAMIGHNPGLQELALMLVGEGQAQDRASLMEKYPTGALAVIDFPAYDWADIEPGSGYLARFVTPRSLK